MYVADRLIASVCAIDYPRELLEIQVLDDSTDETVGIAELAVRRFAAEGIDIKYIHRSDRTGYKAGALEAGLKQARGEFVGIFDADFLPEPGLPDAVDAALRRPEDRDGPGALGPHQPGLLAAHEDPVDPARRPFRPRARRTQSRGPVLQLQRHGRRLAARGDRRCRRLAARYADRGSRPELPRAAARLAVRVPLRSDRAGGSPGRDERLQVAAASLGQGVDPDLPQAPAADPARRHSARRQGRSVLPPDGELQLPVDVRAVGPDVPVDGHPLQHGLVRDDADRRPAVLRGDLLGLQLLHGLPARDSSRLAHPPQVPAVPDVDRHRAVHQQHARGASRRCSTSRPSSPARRSTGSKGIRTSGSARSTVSRSRCSR